MDREAEFRRLYEAHRAAVHAYFTGRTSDSQSAADLMQDVFLRVWQHLDKLTDMPDDRQRAWIFTVARNLSVDAHRHQHTQVGAEQALAREPARPPQPASRAVIAAERVAVVGEAIRRLPEPQRVTLTMAAAGRDDQHRDRRRAGRARRHRALPAVAGPAHPGRGARPLR